MCQIKPKTKRLIILYILFSVNFTTPMPDTNYIVQVTGQRSANGDVANGCIQGGSTFASVATTTNVLVNFFGSSTSEQDVMTGCVTIMSVI